MRSLISRLAKTRLVLALAQFELLVPYFFASMCVAGVAAYLLRSGNSFAPGPRDGAIGALIFIGLFALPILLEGITGWTPRDWLGHSVRRSNGEPTNVSQRVTRCACKWSGVVLSVVVLLLEPYGRGHALVEGIAGMALVLLGLTLLSVIVAPLTQNRTWYDWISGTAVFERVKLSNSQPRGFEVSMKPQPTEQHCNGPA